jgi:hypothetical protein
VLVPGVLVSVLSMLLVALENRLLTDVLFDGAVQDYIVPITE